MLGVHQHTLRIYEDEGLITPARRSNQRLYSEADIELLQHIRYLTSVLGLNLAGVHLIFQLERAGRVSFAEIQTLAVGKPIAPYGDSASGQAKTMSERTAS
jgi:DNA-binding transcriptional MerR regulator